MLTRLTQVYLKLEWKRVKSEVEGESKEIIENKISELESQYKSYTIL